MHLKYSSRKDYLTKSETARTLNHKQARKLYIGGTVAEDDGIILRFF